MTDRNDKPMTTEQHIAWLDSLYTVVPNEHKDKALCCVEYEDEYDAIHETPDHVDHKEVKLTFSEIAQQIRNS